MADGRLETLLPRLIELTRAGEVSWTPLPTEGENTFVHALPGGAGTLVVRRMYSTYQLTLHNAYGAQLESVGELQEVAGVATLWQLIDARRKEPADVYAALVDDLRVEDRKTP
ncbi:MAG: hypothetical protein J2P45_12790 [Candidatus Dormibacteraeota bacterium]|nr:hypothetical protein [Candidatus Dormibacteraeota bacterium]